MLTAWSKFRSAACRFRHARDGNIAITFAIALIPLLGFLGAAIDYSRANMVRTQLQNALDSTALMISKAAPNLSDVSTNGQSSPLDSKASAIFKSLFDASEATNIKLNATYSTTGGSTVKIDASADVPTSFLSIIGFNTIGVGSSTTSKWGSKRLRVALVLDNTGSMNWDGKLSALKTATKNLLTQLQNAATVPDDVYVSIIPFVKDIAVDKSYASASWIDWTDWDAKNGTCSGAGGKSGGGKGKYGSSHGWMKSSLATCSGTWKPNNHNTWKGCITDRGNSSGPVSDYDRLTTAPTASIPETLFPADQYNACPQAVMGLSYDWTAMNALVNKMKASGTTNQPIGLVWGWQSLVGGGPFTVPPMDSNYEYDQIIILLSDGLNTQDRWYSNQSSIDKRMYDPANGAGTCANIKAAGITIYTIQVNTGGDPTSALLQNCASSPDKFFLLTSASQIMTTFDTIATNLTKLRVAK